MIHCKWPFLYFRKHKKLWARVIDIHRGILIVFVSPRLYLTSVYRTFNNWSMLFKISVCEKPHNSHQFQTAAVTQKWYVFARVWDPRCRTCWNRRQLSGSYSGLIFSSWVTFLKCPGTTGGKFCFLRIYMNSILSISIYKF